MVGVWRKLELALAGVFTVAMVERGVGREIWSVVRASFASRRSLARRSSMALGVEPRGGEGPRVLAWWLFPGGVKGRESEGVVGSGGECERDVTREELGQRCDGDAGCGWDELQQELGGGQS